MRVSEHGAAIGVTVDSLLIATVLPHKLLRGKGRGTVVIGQMVPQKDEPVVVHSLKIRRCGNGSRKALHGSLNQWLTGDLELAQAGSLLCQ